MNVLEWISSLTFLSGLPTGAMLLKALDHALERSRTREDRAADDQGVLERGSRVRREVRADAASKRLREREADLVGAVGAARHAVGRVVANCDPSQAVFEPLDMPRMRMVWAKAAEKLIPSRLAFGKEVDACGFALTVEVRARLDEIRDDFDSLIDSIRRAKESELTYDEMTAREADFVAKLDGTYSLVRDLIYGPDAVASGR
ncbi:MAG: hypothetical protein AAFR54_11190 [Planctomycetota bacterium]